MKPAFTFLNRFTDLKSTTNHAVIFAQWLYKKGWSVRVGIGDHLIWVQREGHSWGEEPERLTTEELYARFEKEMKGETK